MVLDVKSVDRLLGTPVPYAYAIKAGPWIFLTGHEAYDWETGTSDEVTGPPGFPLHGRQRSRREGDFILRRMRRVLGEFGSDLSHAIRLDQYYPGPRAVASYHLARGNGANRQPVVRAVLADGRGCGARSNPSVLPRSVDRAGCPSPSSWPAGSTPTIAPTGLLGFRAGSAR